MYCYDRLTDSRIVPVSYTHLDVYKRQVIHSFNKYSFLYVYSTFVDVVVPLCWL